MRIIDVEYITQSMSDENAFVLRCEELFHDKISRAAARIINARDRGSNIVCLTGPSGSGKTTTALRLRDYLENLCVPVHMISMDNFFIPDSLRPKEATDHESPYCVDRDRLIDCIYRLRRGEKVEMPTFDFTNSSYGPTYIEQGNTAAVIIAEGIHMLNPLIFDSLRENATGIYAAPRTRVLTGSEKVVNPQALRLARRMLRDYYGRARSLCYTVTKMESVDRGEEKHIKPFRENASIHIDTFHDYEPCILAMYLKEMPEYKNELTPEFVEKHGLTDLIELVESVPPLVTQYVPRDSVMREFVGGSVYKY